MQSSNIREYEIIRQEMLSVKECITNYIGYVLGGSGVAVFGIVVSGAYISEGKININSFIYLFPILAAFISLIISFILLIIYYKFSSHNRFAGYCKLISLENHELLNDVIDTPLFLWENSLDKLRESHYIRDAYIKILDDATFYANDKELVKNLLLGCLGKKPPIDNNKYKNGYKVLKRSIQENYSSQSWAFPPFIVSMFFFLASWFYLNGVVLFAYGIYCIYKVKQLRIVEFILYVLFKIENVYVLFILITVFIVHVFIWRKYIGTLHSLMEGSQTINMFCAIFIPARIQLLKENGIKAKYNSV